MTLRRLRQEWRPGAWTNRLVPSFCFYLFVVSGNATGATAISGGSVSEMPFLNTFANTRAWDVWFPNPETVRITHVGVFDLGGDGLENSHAVGLWEHTLTETRFLGSAIVPAGTDGELIDGYRYVEIAPMAAPQFMRIGAFYQANDADDVARPTTATFSPEVSLPVFDPWYVSLESDGLTFPDIGVTRNMEGEPNYSFYHANFTYEVIPEPRSSVLLMAGFGVLCLRAWRRRPRPM